MNQLKKIERRLSKLRRLQKQLDKKKRKVGRLVTKNKKKEKHVRRLVKAQKTVPTPQKNMIKKAVFGVVIGSVCGVVASKIVGYVKANGCCCMLRRNVQEDADNEFLQAQESQAEYDKASLEELEDALLRVENELDEVSAAIENAKK